MNDRVSKTVERLEQFSSERNHAVRETIQNQLDQSEAELKELTEQHVAAQVDHTTTADAIRQQRQKLHERQQELELKVAGADARQEAIVQQIALLREQTLEKAEQDEITKQLQTIVELATEELHQFEQLVETKQISQLELGRAETELAKARIELLRHQQGNQDSPMAKQIASLNEQLTAVTIELAESRKILEFAQRQWERTQLELQEQLLLEGKLQTLEAELAQRREQVQHLQTQLREAESAIAPRSMVRIVPWNE